MGQDCGYDREELCSYGMSRSGVELTDDVIELMAVEAEAGLDVTKLRRRPGGPRMGSASAEGGSRLPEGGLSLAPYWPSPGRLRP
jgi:hypothetical protein